MAVRLLCLMLLGFTSACWAMTLELEHMNAAAMVGMSLFYAGGCLLSGYGIITGKAPS